MKKITVSLLCVLLLCSVFFCPGAAAGRRAAAAQTETVMAAAPSQFLLVMEKCLRAFSLFFSTFFSQLFSPADWFSPAETQIPKARVTARELLLTDVPSDGGALTLGTLQGLLADRSETNLFFRAGAYAAFLPRTGAKLTQTQPDGRPWDLTALLQKFAGFLDGYILCDDESAAVAVSLSRQLNSVAVPEAVEAAALAAGLRRTFDARGKDDAWLRRSPYFCRLNRAVAFEQRADMAPRLVDYAVMCGAYFGFSASDNPWKHREKYAFLKNNALVFGWNQALGEYETVAAFAKQNACLVPADHAYNLSVLSGYDLAPFRQHTQAADDTDAAPAHTVCLLMSDGDNLQWLLNDYNNAAHFGSPVRGAFPFGWGVPAAAADLAAPMLQTLYDAMSPRDEFVLSLSGVGYTFPSKWTNLTALRHMARTLPGKMEAMDVSSLLVLDDGGFYSPAVDLLAKESGANGILYIDYADYAGLRGAVRFAGDTPVVAARYRLWADAPGCSPEEIAAAINQSALDPADPASYSFVIVHAWSGLDGNGNLAEGGDTMAAVQALVNALDENTRIVTPARFLDLIRRART